MNIKTWQEEAKEWPDHRRGLTTNQMIWMQQEIDELRAAYEAQAHRANALALVINDLTKICTHTAETKDQFIERVKAILSFDPDLRASEMQVAYEALQKENADLKEEVKILDGMCTAINKKFAQSSESNAAQAKRIDEAVSRIKDMLENDDGQAHKEARKFIESLSASKNGE